MKNFLLSACLAGKRVRYNGTDAKIEDPDLQELVDKGLAVIVCPELDGGLEVPRKPCEIKGLGGGKGVLKGCGRVLNSDSEDLTEAFFRGAEAVLEKAIKNGCSAAILKQNSPSCGTSIIYDGNFSGTKINGMGVCAALLAEKKLKLFSEDSVREAIEYIKTDE